MTDEERVRARAGTPDRLVSTLRKSDDFTRAKIIEKLVSSPSKELVEQVVRLLDEKNTSVRMDALDILRRTGTIHIDAVIRLLYHDNEDIRVYGCEVLGSLKHPAALPHLIEKVLENNENVRNAAVVALGEFDDQRAVNVLLAVLEQEEWVAFSAIYSLAKIGNRKAVPALLNVFKNQEDELSLAACEALLSFREGDTIDEIIEFIHHLEKEKKRTFVRIIIEQGDSRVFEKLVLKAGDALLVHLLNYLKSDKKKSLDVVNFLAYFQHRDSARAMLDIMTDMDSEGEEYDRVLRLFTDLREVWAPNLNEYLEVEEYALPVIRACGIVGCTISEDLLLKAFSSSALETKREIIKQLGRISNGNGHRVIREAMKDSDGHIQADAVAIAGVMGLRDLTPDIVNLAKKGFPDVRTKALLSLLRLDLPTALAAVELLVRDGNSEDKKTYLSVTSHLDARTNFPFLKGLIGDPDERIRQMTIRVIGNFLEHDEYLTLFEAVLRSGDVPNEVLKVIGEKRLIGFKNLLMELALDPLQALWTRYHALVALSVFADPSLFPVFVKTLKEKENLVKIGCLKALSELRDKRAIPHIRPYTKSADEDVKTAAQMAIGRLSQ